MRTRTRASVRAEAANATTKDSSREPSITPPSSERGTESDNDSGLEVLKPATRKRARKELENSGQPSEPPVKRVRGKKGKLRGLMNMPIEVFIEVSKYLYPLDLILLARANKFFRNLLMNRSAIQTWRHALNNVPELPPCPKDLCEPRYAALLFSKHCSLCGNQALRPMDPVLHVRLCVSCRGSQLVAVGYRLDQLVHTSSSIVPSKGNRPVHRCLRHESDVVRAKLEELERSGDLAAAAKWRSEKMDEVAKRINDAQPLARFLKNIEEENKDDIALRKGGRAEEICSRLLKLGWVEADFVMREKDAIKKWNSLVCVARPLTERGWKGILPQLNELLENRREQRLKEEKAARRYRRSSRISQWIYSYLEKLPPYVVLDDCAGLAAWSAITDHDSSHQLQPSTYGDFEKKTDQKNKYLNWPTPSVNLVSTWAPFRHLLDTDRPHEEFETALEEERSTLMDLLVEWRTKTEETLAGYLSSHSDSSHESSVAIVAENLAGPSPTSSPGHTIPGDSHPVKSILLETQQLFRADAVFARHSSDMVFYPDDLQGVYPDYLRVLKPAKGASDVARALLTALGRPDASYLEMKAMGAAFTCERCCTQIGVTWKQLVSFPTVVVRSLPVV